MTHMVSFLQTEVIRPVKELCWPYRIRAKRFYSDFTVKWLFYRIRNTIKNPYDPRIPARNSYRGDGLLDTVHSMAESVRSTGAHSHPWIHVNPAKLYCPTIGQARFKKNLRQASA